MNSLNSKFKKELLISLKQKLEISNVMAVPKLSKIVVNMGVKDVLANKKNLEKASVALEQIAGQKPGVTKSKKAIASFKLQKGEKIGLVTTLRGKRMYDFFEKLIAVVMPRLRDFHGVKRESFDGFGNYTLGFIEHTVFPEIDPGKVDIIQGLEVTIVTTAKNDKDGLALLEMLGMPFQKVKS